MSPHGAARCTRWTPADAGTGKLLWAHYTRYSVDSSPAVANGVVYFGSFDHKLYALNAKTGVTLWSYATGYIVESSPAVRMGWFMSVRRTAILTPSA